MAKLLVWSILCLLAVCTASDRFNDCQRPCPMNLDPVCGTDGKTYPNKCSLAVAACQARRDHKPEIQRAYNGKCGRPSPLLSKQRPSFYQMTPEIQQKLSEKKSTNNCLRPCPRNFDFVCASNGRTYSNPCVMQVEACEQQKTLTIAHKGPCPNGQGTGALLKMLMTVKDVCPVMCPANYAPVCGDNGKTYPNECALKYDGCRTKTVIRTAHTGPCKEFYRQPKRAANVTKELGNEDCVTVCPYNMDPVCGTDGNTYPNLCSLKSEACRKKLDLKLAHRGKC